MAWHGTGQGQFPPPPKACKVREGISTYRVEPHDGSIASFYSPCFPVFSLFPIARFGGARPGEYILHDFSLSLALEVAYVRYFT
jgi:hypothetical protein